MFEEGQGLGDEPCTSVAKCWLMCEVAGGVSLGPQTLRGRYEMCIQMDVDCVLTQCASHYCGTGLLKVLDRRQVSQLVVITAVTVLPCTCSPPQRTGPKCPPVWPLHSTSGRWS